MGFFRFTRAGEFTLKSAWVFDPSACLIPQDKRQTGRSHAGSARQSRPRHVRLLQPCIVFVLGQPHQLFGQALATLSSRHWADGNRLHNGSTSVRPETPCGSFQPASQVVIVSYMVHVCI